MLQILVPLVVFANGLAAGVLVGTQLGGWPLLATLPPQQYVRAHAFFSTRYDPFMPLCLLATVLGDLLLTVLAPGGAARALFALASGCAAGAVAISRVKNVPVNRWVRAVDPDRLPDDFAARDPRPHWGSWNRIRSRLALLALLANGAALATLL